MHKIPQEFGRLNLINGIDDHETVLEIGPFTKPIVRGDRVKYFDVLDRNGLIARAQRSNYKFESAPEIHYVSPVGDLSVVDDTFDVCISSHCVEHQPDLISHLNKVYDILKPKGRYLLIVPDKRYCFDHFLPESTLADVMDGIGRTVHTIGNVLRHRGLVTHNEPLRHWNGDHGAPRGYAQPAFFIDAIKEFHDANGGYVDVHAWQFTPSSFRILMDMLKKLDLIKFDCPVTYATPFGRFEFCAILTKSN